MKIKHKQSGQERDIKYSDWVKLRTKSQFNVIQIEQLGTLRKQTVTHRHNMGIFEESDAMAYVESDPTSFTFGKIPHNGLMVIEPNVFVYKTEGTVIEKAFPPEPLKKIDPWTIGGFIERFNINFEIKWWGMFWKWYHEKPTHAALVALIAVFVIFIVGVILKRCGYY